MLDVGWGHLFSVGVQPTSVNMIMGSIIEIIRTVILLPSTFERSSRGRQRIPRWLR
jgi:hypothetical protein